MPSRPSRVPTSVKRLGYQARQAFFAVLFVFLMLAPASLSPLLLSAEAASRPKSTQNKGNSTLIQSFAPYNTAHMSDTNRIAKLEETVFVTTYQGEENEKRLERLEKTVFGESFQKRPAQERLKQLEDAIVFPRIEPEKPQDALGQSRPYQQPYSYGSPNYNAQKQPHHPSGNSPPAQASATQSATESLQEMEQYLLNKTYPKEAVLPRLERLEKAVYKDPKTGGAQKGSINQRISALKQTVLGENPPSSPQYSAVYTEQGAQPYPPFNQYPTSTNPSASSTPPPYSQQPYPSQPYSPPPGVQNTGDPSGYGNTNTAPQDQQYSANGDPLLDGQTAASQADMSAALGNLEQDLLKTTYPNEPIPNRLSRLETKVFKQASPEMEEGDRLERLIAVVSGGGDNPRGSGAKGSGWQALLPFIIMIPLLLL
ncbi:MAG: hypothetical protein VKJ04_11505 [Vampirovibrionales bacterium]|nr:hypothetical protein [Vampirovibrionales bacterium]